MRVGKLVIIAVVAAACGGKSNPPISANATGSAVAPAGSTGATAPKAVTVQLTAAKTGEPMLRGVAATRR